MAKTLKNVSDVIQALGGRAAVAEAFDLRVTSIGNWITDNQMPPQTYRDIQSLLSRRRLKGDWSLWRWHRARSSRRS